MLTNWVDLLVEAIRNTHSSYYFQSHSVTELLLLKIIRMECALTHLTEILIIHVDFI